MLLHYLLALLLATLFLAARLEACHQRDPAIVRDVAEHGEEAAERKLRRQNDREEEQGQDQDDRAGAIEIVGEESGEAVAEIAAGAELLAGDVERAERE